MGIIDYGTLEKYIKQIEKIFTDNELTQLEQQIILQQILNRNAMKTKKQQIKDMTGADMIKNLMHTIRGTKEE